MNRAALLLAAGAIAACGPRDPPRATAFDSLLAVGEQIYRREEYDSARLVLSPIAERARAAGDSIAEARALTWLGLAAWRLGDYARARAEQERAVALKVALGLERELWRSYNGLGLVAWHEGRLADAITRFDAALSVAERVADTVAMGSTAGNLALVHTELGDFDAARRGFLRMRDVGRGAENGRVEANALNNLGMLAIRIGDPAGALPFLRDARRIYQAIDYATGEQNALGQLGTAYAALGEPQQALAALDSALHLARRLGLQQEEASNLEAIAELHRVAGDFARALDLYAAAKALNQQLGQPVELGADLRSEAEIYVQLGDLELARRSAAQALATHRAAGARFEELGDLLLLADIADRSSRPADVTAHLAAGRRLVAALDVRLARVGVALVEARIADRRRESSRVLRVLGAAAPDLAAGGYDTEWEAQLLRARAERRLGHLAQAAEAGRRAVAAVERVRRNYGSGILRTAYGSDRGEAYAELVSILQRQGRLEEAFAVSDAARGRALLEYRAADRGAGAAGPLAERAALLGEIGGLTAGIEVAERDVEGPADTAGRATLAHLYGRLDKARGRYEALLAQAGSGVPAGALLGAGDADAADVQAILASDEALLELLVAEDRVFGFVVTRAGLTAFESRITQQNLASRVRLARAALARPGGAPGDAPVLESLHALLIAPARLAAGVRRLVVVPHGVLSYLPFAALRDSASGRYLVESHSILYVPSAGALPALRRRDAGGATPGRAVVFAPFPDRLPATAVEAAALRRVLRADVRAGARATEGQFRRALAAGGAVHAATHGVLNAQNPLFSRIEFARASDGGPADDGRLEVHELLGLRVTSPLVFLSGCETGLGTAGSTDFARGEDFATLAQAFLYAGADNVIATLWRVEDEGAAAFAERFYGHLAKVPPPEGLAAAQRDMLANRRFAAPFYWASYALSGDGLRRRGAQEAPVVSVQQEQGSPFATARSHR